MKKLIVIFQLLMLVLVVPAQAQNQKKDFRKDFEAFKKKAKKEYADFRKKEKKKMAKREKSNKILPVATVVPAPAPATKQPQPLAKVEQTSDPNPYYKFDVFGTECKVRMGNNCRFTLPGVSGDEVADAINQFTKPQFDNMLYDCLEERKAHNFSDWAYTIRCCLR